ncbi:MAG TPA: hypothetical protein VG273_26725 [Bryobacteraceae bacterium]|jgi:hypothetical protein|nr:hypothetical protein [Bryobacteraceae bacterium]
MPEIRLQPIPAPAFVLFATGCALGIPLNFVGNLLAGEILLAVFAVAGVAANLGNSRFLDRRLIAFAGVFLLSLCVYMATDFFAGTELHDALRGWARFVFLILDFIGIYVIGRKSRFNLFPLLIGYMAGQVAVWGRPGAGEHWYVTAWKHHLCLPVLIGLLGVAGLCSRRARYSILLLSLAGIVSFQIDTRAFGMICFVTAAMLATRAMVFRRIGNLMPFILFAALLISAGTIGAILNNTQTQFGKRQMGSNEMRYAAVATALQTIAANPAVGLGSWKTDFEAANRHRANLIEAGGSHDTESYDQSGHSQLLQTWLEGGPLAAMAFFYLLWRMLISLWWTLKRPVDRFLAFAIFVLLNGIWSCLFSPFLGADVRINVAVSIYVCISLAIEKSQNQRRALA